jgi:hypothetical protein
MSNTKRKWHCPRCSRDSSRHWNMKVHIKRKHSGVGEPIDEAKEFKEKRGHQFFSYNQSYGMNDLSMGNQLGKEKEPDIIDVMYQVVMEEKEKLRKIMEIKGFLNELSSLSSSAQPHITTGLSQTPIIEPIIPSPITTNPLQPTPPISASAVSSQEQKKQNINPLTALANLFYTSTFMAEDLQRRIRRIGKREDIIIPQEPSLSPYMMTTISDDNNNNNSKKRESNRIAQNTKAKKELGEDRHYIVGQPLSKLNLLMGNPDDGDIDGDRYVWDGDGDFYFPGGKWRIKRDSQGNVIDARKIITDPTIYAKHVTLNDEEEKAAKK